MKNNAKLYSFLKEFDEKQSKNREARKAKTDKVLRFLVFGGRYLKFLILKWLFITFFGSLSFLLLFMFLRGLFR